MKAQDYLTLHAGDWWWEHLDQFTGSERFFLKGRLVSFYSQPFDPEIIPELFVGWEMVGSDEWTFWAWNRSLSYRYVSDGMHTGFGPVDINGDPDTASPPIRTMVPQTLNDFIRDCQRAGIDLEWKTENKEIKKTFGL